MKLRHLAVIAFFFMLMAANRPYTHLVDRLIEAIDGYITTYAPEKIYLMTDRHVYSGGETLWYRGWLVNAETHRPSSISRLMHVELYHPDFGVVDRQIVRVDEGATQGDFFLPDSLTPGRYQIQAYTRWMGNEDPRYFFRKYIDIAGSSDEREQFVAHTAQPKVEFFPEGGSMIAGAGSVLGIRSYDDHGNPVSLEGAILDDENRFITDFSTNEAGMGRVFMLPQYGRTYHADIVTGFERSATFSLPESQSSGYTITANTLNPDHLTFQLGSYGVGTEVVMLAHVRGRVCYVAESPNQYDTTFTVNMSRDTCPAGIVYVTVFDKSGRPVAERLVYNPLRTDHNTRLESNKTDYETREKVQFTFSVSGRDEEEYTGNFAVSATHRRQTGRPSPETIADYLLFRSELGGNVTVLAEADTATLRERLFHTDLQLLTHGWRKYDWGRILESSHDVVHTAEPGFTVRGQILSKGRNPKPAQDQYVILALLGKVEEFRDTFTDENGHFMFTEMLYPDQTKAFFQTLDSKEKRSYDIVVDSLRPSTFYVDPVYWLPRQYDTAGSYGALLAAARLRAQYDQAFGTSTDTRMLGEVTVTAEREPEKDDHPLKSSVLGTADVVIRGDDPRFTGALNPIDMLRRRPGAFRVTGSGSSTQVTYTRAVSISSSTEPMYLLDGMEVDLMTLINTPGHAVESLELMTDGASLAAYGARGSNGVIAVNTKPGGLVYGEYEGILNMPLLGYYVPQPFYAPDYTENLDVHRKGDHRATVWWQPNLNVENGNAEISFWTTDESGEIDVRVEGILSDGTPVSITRTIIVRR